jgi:hypothetical protein
MTGNFTSAAEDNGGQRVGATLRAPTSLTLVPDLKGVTRITWTSGDLGVRLRHRFIDSITTGRYLVPRRVPDLS